MDLLAGLRSIAPHYHDLLGPTLVSSDHAPQTALPGSRRSGKARPTEDAGTRTSLREAGRLLQSVPGIDYVLALTILAEVGEVKRFPNRKKFAAYAGLVPKNRDSGEKVGVHPKLRHGSP